jgi:hypothetical protein
MRIATQKYGYTFSPDADFHVLYWRIDGAAWDYDMSPNAEIINPTVEGDRHIIDLADYVSGIDGAIDIAIVAGEGDYSVPVKKDKSKYLIGAAVVVVLIILLNI